MFDLFIHPSSPLQTFSFFTANHLTPFVTVELVESLWYLTQMLYGTIEVKTLVNKALQSIAVSSWHKPNAMEVNENIFKRKVDDCRQIKMM